MIEQSRPLRLYPGLAGAIAYYGSRFIARSASSYSVETGANTFALANISSDVAPDGSGNPVTVRTAEANGNLYVPSLQGWLRLDSISGTMRRAGIPRALDPQLTLVAAGTLLANTNSVGYRMVFGIIDGNKNLLLGPPSGRVTTTATAAQNVTVKAFIPTTIVSASNATSYFVQIYRTSVNTVASTDPGEEMLLVYQATLNSTDVSNKFVSFTDATPDNLRGAAGYFCPSQEGIANANYMPPVAHDIALYAESMFYANTTRQYRTQLQLTGVSANLLTISTGAGGITKSGGNGVYTFTGTPDLTNIPTDGTAKLSSTGNTSAGNNGEFVITAVNTGAFTITVTNAGAVTEAGTANSRGWPSKLTIAAVNYYGSINGTETVASQIFKVATAGTASQNVVDTCASLLRVVNQQTSPVVYGAYESGPDDGAGKMSFTEASQGGSSFTIAASGTLLYNSFNPTIPVAAPLTAVNDAAINRLFFSKPSQPEHVPLINYFDIAARSKAILRIIALKGALLVFKEDGVFRVTGVGGEFSITPHDPYVTAFSETSVQQCNNRAYAFCPLGIYEITEISSTPIHAQIADQVRRVAEQFQNATINVPTVRSWATEVDSCVGFTATATSLLDLSLLYCAKTKTWSSLPDDISNFDPASSLFLSRGNARYGLNSFSVKGMAYRNADFGLWGDDPYYDLNSGITSASAALKPLPGHKLALPVTAETANTITFDNSSYALTIPVGSLILGGISNTPIPRLSKVTGVAGTVSVTLTLVAALGSAANVSASGTGYVYLLIPQTATVEWHPFMAGDDGAYSRYTEASPVLDGRSSMTTCTLSMSTEATTSTQTVSMTAANTPLPSGVGTQTIVRSLVPSNMQQARRLSVVFSHNTAGEYLFLRGISYEFTPLGAPAKEIT
jgi:hypothetical protein